MAQAQLRAFVFLTGLGMPRHEIVPRDVLVELDHAVGGDAVDVDVEGREEDRDLPGGSFQVERLLDLFHHDDLAVGRGQEQGAGSYGWGALRITKEVQDKAQHEGRSCKRQHASYRRHFYPDHHEYQRQHDGYSDDGVAFFCYHRVLYSLFVLTETPRYVS